MNLAQMLNNVLEQSGFLSRQSYTGSADPDDKQMVAIANRVAYEIINGYRWPELRNVHKFLMTSESKYDLPSDYQQMVADSVWQEDGSKPVEFPVPDRRWYMYKFTNWSDGGLIRMRQYGDQLEIHDTQPGEEIAFEYISKWYIRSVEDVGKEFFTDDSDTFMLDDQLLILGIQAHWMQTKLMPQYMEHFANYRAKTNEAIGRSTGARTIGGFDGIGNYYNGSPYYPLYRRS